VVSIHYRRCTDAAGVGTRADLEHQRREVVALPVVSHCNSPPLRSSVVSGEEGGSKRHGRGVCGLCGSRIDPWHRLEAAQVEQGFAKP
jgi:hypothetical protein